MIYNKNKKQKPFNERSIVMKRKITVVAILLVLAMALVLPIVFTGCQNRSEILKVYNWSEYIGEDVIEEFEAYYKEVTGKNITVKYDMFDENELMYTQIKTAKADYDVICPSDYMIEKMIKEGLLIKLEDISQYGYEGLEDYRNNMSPLVMSGENSLFTYDYDEETGLYNQYSRTYMWGTMGILYANDSTAYKNSKYGTYSSMKEYVEANGWSVFWDEAYKNKFMLKNSMRDTYVSASIYTLLNERSDYCNASMTPAKALNATDSATVKKIEEMMLKQKGLIKGLENDEGKEQIIQGEIDMVLQWAGDAVYAMTGLQEELGKSRDLTYFVPQEGSNIFSDGWCIPKYSGNHEAANLWINFMCKPEIAVKNMDYIGYTSGVATKATYDYIMENWASEEVTDYAIDLSYYFGEDCGFDTTIYVAEEDYAAFEAQFPTKSIIDRCAVMLDFGDATNTMNALWRNFKA